jgi:hypothetical protein
MDTLVARAVLEKGIHAGNLNYIASSMKSLVWKDSKMWVKWKIPYWIAVTCPAIAGEYAELSNGQKKPKSKKEEINEKAEYTKFLYKLAAMPKNADAKALAWLCTNLHNLSLPDGIDNHDEISTFIKWYVKCNSGRASSSEINIKFFDDILNSKNSMHEYTSGAIKMLATSGKKTGVIYNKYEYMAAILLIMKIGLDKKLVLKTLEDKRNEYRGEKVKDNLLFSSSDTGIIYPEEKVKKYINEISPFTEDMVYLLWETCIFNIIPLKMIHVVKDFNRESIFDSIWYQLWIKNMLSYSGMASHEVIAKFKTNIFPVFRKE